MSHNDVGSSAQQKDPPKMSIILHNRHLYNLQQQQTINNQNKLTDHIQAKNGQVMVVTFQPGHFQFLLRFLCRWFFQKMSDLNTFRTAATATVLCFAFSSPTGRRIIQPSTCHIECRTNRSSWSLYSKIRKIKEDILEHEYDSKVIQACLLLFWYSKQLKYSFTSSYSKQFQPEQQQNCTYPTPSQTKTRLQWHWWSSPTTKCRRNTTFYWPRSSVAHSFGRLRWWICKCGPPTPAGEGTASQRRCVESEVKVK